MSVFRALALLFTLALLAAPAHAQDGKIKIEKFNHSEWTKGIFSEAVTVTGIGNAKFVYLAGVGAEDENGPRGTIRHPGNFIEQCKYAYDKIKRVLAATRRAAFRRGEDHHLHDRPALPARHGQVHRRVVGRRHLPGPHADRRGGAGLPRDDRRGRRHRNRAGEVANVAIAR